MNQIQVSGMKLIAICEYDNKKYYFFGDEHFSYEGSCIPETEPALIQSGSIGRLSMPNINDETLSCSDINVKTGQKIGNNRNCYDITRLIDELITVTPDEYTSVY